MRILYDDDVLYVGARLEDDPGAVADQLVRRDQEGQYDYLQVMLEPNLDRQSGYLLRVSAAGAERNAFLFEDTRQDVDFDAVWASAVHQDSAGWSMEMRIPVSQIRYDPADSAQRWGVDVERRRLASNSVSYFSLESRTVRGGVSQFGLLTDVEVGGRRFLELEPSCRPTSSALRPSRRTRSSTARTPGWTSGSRRASAWAPTSVWTPR